MMQDLYIWNVVYKDGSYISEYDDPQGRGFADVDATRVKALDIEPVLQILVPHRILVPEGATPVFFRRRYIVVNPGDQHKYMDGQTVHCIGWKQGEQAVYLFAFNDGSTLLSTDLQAV